MIGVLAESFFITLRLYYLKAFFCVKPFRFTKRFSTKKAFIYKNEDKKFVVLKIFALCLRFTETSVFFQSNDLPSSFPFL